MSEQLAKDPSTLKDNELARSDFENFASNLELTYLVRIYAEFESGLRDYWKVSLKRRTKPQFFDLLNAISSRQKIDFELIENIKLVQNYRNKLIHEDHLKAQEIDIREGRKFLCAFFQRLPEDWYPNHPAIGASRP